MVGERSTQPSAEVPLLDWPADLFTSDAAIVDIIAEDCSFRNDSPAMWYGNHIPECTLNQSIPRPGTNRTLRGAAMRIAAEEMTRHARARKERHAYGSRSHRE